MKCPKCDSIDLEKTRSSLIIEFLRIVYDKKPKFLIYENVKNLVGKEFTLTFNCFLNELKDYGYNVYYKVLNAKYFNIPQNRERVILVAIRKDVDNGKFEFPKNNTNIPKLNSLLETNVNKSLYMNINKKNDFLNALDDEVKDKLLIAYKNWLNNNKNQDGLLFPLCCASRGRYIYNPSSRLSGLPTKQRIEINYNNTTNTLTSVLKDNYILEPCVISNEEKQKRLNNKNLKFDTNYFNIRKLSSLEYYKLMGFSEEDYFKAKYYSEKEIEQIKKSNQKYKIELDKYGKEQISCINETDLYKQGGNSIVTNVLFAVYKEIFNAMPNLFDDLKVVSLFSGIGAFEKGLDMFYQWKESL